ncbi:MAG: metal ABC transporter permease [Planctomycetota bacterium]|nr:metal ABC transporter permease [Planctomycetota bacterium]
MGMLTVMRLRAGRGAIVDLRSAIELFWPGLVAAGAVAPLCALLSPLVALKRLAFIGQGVSHAAFGGIGIATALGLGASAQFGVVGVFCVASALVVAWMSDRKTTSADTLIGVMLVGSMALGAVLISREMQRGGGPAPAWEEVLFGSLLAVTRADAGLAWGVGLMVAAVMAVWRRPLLFWAFDEPGAEAFGVSVGAMKTLLMALLAVTIVVSMKWAGVVLATALLILPGATALRLSRRMGLVFVISMVVSVVGMGAGLWGAFAWELPPGACVVGALLVMFAASWPVGAMVASRGGAAAGAR